jgi:hypothetical protein
VRKPKVRKTIEPGLYLIPAQPGGLLRKVRVLGGMRRFPEIIHPAMFLGIVVDVGDQLDLGANQNATKGVLKQGAGAFLRSVECFRACIQQI